MRIRVLVRPALYAHELGSGPRITGQVTEYHPYESLSIERTGLRIPWQRRVETVSWIDIGRIDVPHGRNTIGGVALGVGVGASAVLSVAFYCKIWGGQDCMSQGWRLTRSITLVAIPVGAVWGFFSTRWKRVY